MYVCLMLITLVMWYICHVSLAHTSLPAAAQRVNPDLSLPEATPPSMSASDKAVAACCGGNVQALQVLLLAGISVNYASSSTGSTLVHMAAYCGQVCRPLFISSSYTLLTCGYADSSCPYFFPPAAHCTVLDVWLCGLILSLFLSSSYMLYCS